MTFGTLDRGPDFSSENCKICSLTGHSALTQITLWSASRVHAPRLELAPPLQKAVFLYGRSLLNLSTTALDSVTGGLFKYFPKKTRYLCHLS